MLAIEMPMMEKINVIKRVELVDETKDFLELITPIKRKLYNYILKALSFSEDAEDVFQEVIIRGYKYFSKFDQGRLFSVWIYTITHNEIKRYYKLKKNKQTDKIDDRSFSLDLEENDEKKKISDIYRIAEELKPKHREIFFLFYYNGFSINEISTICNIKDGNVKFILNKARNSIKDILGGKDG